MNRRATARRRRKASITAMTFAVIFAGSALSSCSTTPDLSEMNSQWSPSYRGPYTLDEMTRFPVEQKVLGTIVEIGEPFRADIDSEAFIIWAPVKLAVESASPELESGEFTIRLIPGVMSDVSDLKVGGRVLYLGDSEVQDRNNPGPPAGTPGWILTVGSQGELGATYDRDIVEGNLRDFADVLGLTLPPGLNR